MCRLQRTQFACGHTSPIHSSSRVVYTTTSYSVAYGGYRKSVTTHRSDDATTEMPTGYGTNLEFCNQSQKYGMRCRRPLEDLNQKIVAQASLCRDCANREMLKKRAANAKKRETRAENPVENDKVALEQEKRWAKEMLTTKEEIQKVSQKLNMAMEKKTVEVQMKQVEAKEAANKKEAEKPTSELKTASKQEAKEVKQSEPMDMEEWDLCDREEFQFEETDEGWISCNLE